MNTSKKSKTKFFKFNLNRSIMKNNYGKQGLMVLMLMAGTAIQAQDTSTAIGRQTDATLGQVTTSTASTPDATNPNTAAGTAGATVQGGAIRVIDNKGTKKYLQVQNGITQVTDLAPDGGIITTWQLGGQLASDTDIDFNANALSFDNVLQTTDAPSADVRLTSPNDGSASGWTLLVRDEDTGEIKKLLASDLIVSGQTVFTATTGTLTYDVAAGVPAMAGVQIPLPSYEKVWVYRNGAKLIANVDYTIEDGTSVVTLVENATAPNDWTLFTGDIIEVQYFK